jgi:hypothetical protein
MLDEIEACALCSGRSRRNWAPAGECWNFLRSSVDFQTAIRLNQPEIDERKEGERKGRSKGGIELNKRGTIWVA